MELLPWTQCRDEDDQELLQVSLVPVASLTLAVLFALGIIVLPILYVHLADHYKVSVGAGLDLHIHVHIYTVHILHVHTRHSILETERSTTELPRQLSWLGPNLTSHVHVYIHVHVVIMGMYNARSQKEY